MQRKRDAERQVRAAVDADPDKKKKFAPIWDDVAAAYKGYASFFKPYYLLEVGAESELFLRAREVIRYAEETKKPNHHRLRGYQDPGLPSLEQEMYSPDPLNNPLEELMLAEHFRFLAKELGANDATVKVVLAGQTPEQAAHNYVSTSKIQEVEERKRLAHDLDAVKNSTDGMIRRALILDTPARKYRQKLEGQG